MSFRDIFTSWRQRIWGHCHLLRQARREQGGDNGGDADEGGDKVRVLLLEREGEKKVVMEGWRKGVMPLIFQVKMRRQFGGREVSGRDGMEGASGVLGGVEEVRRRRLEGGGLIEGPLDAIEVSSSKKIVGLYTC